MSKKKSYKMRTEKQEQRRKTKRFFIAFFACFAVFACFSALYLLISYDFDLSSLTNVRSEETTLVGESSEPASFDGNDRYILLFCTDNERETVRMLSIVRVNLESRKFTVCTQSENELIRINGISNTFFDHYKSGGVKRLVEAVEAFNGIKIDRYICANDTTFKKAINYAGQLKITLPEQLNFRDGEFSLVLIEGEQKLRGDDLLKYVRYCRLSGDRGFTDQSVIVGEMIRQYITPKVLENDDRLFTRLVNTLDTNITAMDYKDAKDELAFIASNEFEIEIIQYFKETVG